MMPIPIPASGLSSPRPGWLFQQLRWNLLRNAARVVMNGSPVRLVTIVLCSALVWVTVFGISGLGFLFLEERQIPFVGALVGLMFDFLFLSLSVMLIFSGGIILYSSLFGSPETAFLLSTPARADQVFAYKYQGALGFSSWAFLLLGSPVLIAYGIASGVPWYFYALLPLFFLGFVLLPGSVGALLCLLIVNFTPRARRQVLVLGVLLVLAGAGYLVYRGIRAAALPDAPDAVQQLLGSLAFARSHWFPSHWMSHGLLSAARGDLGETLYCLTLVWGNGLALYLFTAWVSSRLYRRGYNRLATGGTLRRRYGGVWLDAALSGLLALIDPQTRLLIVKDFRTFRRDPAQWAQIAIFGGLMLLYVMNTRRFYTQTDIGRPYQNGISLLNLAVTALLMCAYTGRFIYPMLSLEGRKFWLLGLLPLKRERLLWGKFVFAATGGLLVAEPLIVLSDVLLGVSPVVVLLHALATAVLALGLSGLSVGLGASMPNFRETDPSKIAVGFGGTLNLVASLLFMVLVVTLIAGPYHVYAVSHEEREMLQAGVLGVLLLGVACGVTLGIAAVVLPLRAGARTLRAMEF
jgi:ABC-2 type transport system permease protein